MFRLGHNNWRQAVNYIESLPQEAEGVKLACLPSWPDERDYNFGVFAGMNPLPSAFIRREEMPPVRDQGRFGTCVGHAAWAVKSWQEIQQKDLPAGGLSPLFIYSRCKAKDGLAAAGTYPRVAMEVIREEGVCSEALMPYSQLAGDVRPPQPSVEAMEEAKKYRAKAYARLDGVREIKRALVEQGPVLGAILICENFLRPDDGRFVDLPQGNWLGGHAITICGYDDNLSHFYKSRVGRTGFFLVQNSWGGGWGDGGFAWLPYDFVVYRLVDPPMPVFFEAWSCIDLPFELGRAGRIVLKVGEKEAWIDGRIVTYDAAPEVVEPGRMLVQVRLIAEAMGLIVNWQRETGIVEIINPSKA